jgi:hypothetical protein
MNTTLFFFQIISVFFSDTVKSSNNKNIRKFPVYKILIMVLINSDVVVSKVIRYSQFDRNLEDDISKKLRCCGATAVPTPPHT